MSKINNVWAIYFSPTKSTELVTTRIAANLASILDADYHVADITKPKDRKKPPTVGRDSFIVLGVPVYAGRVPYFLTDFLKKIKGNGNIGAAVVVYGNRDYGDALAELKGVMNNSLIKVVGAGAFIGEHSFTDKVAGGRPDDDDLDKVKEFYTSLGEKVLNEDINEAEVPGNPEPDGYYQAPTADGRTSSLVGAVPVTDADLCMWCRDCARACPMDAISYMKPAEIEGKCVLCGACIKACEKGAKSFTDPDYIFHKEMLEKEYADRKEPEIFL